MMSDSDVDDLAQEPNAVEVSSSESQYHIQCEDVRLISSQLRPILQAEDDFPDSLIAFRIKAYVESQQALSVLEVQVKHISKDEDEEIRRYYLRFSLLANFVSSQEIDREEMADFARMFTLSILWPYAREYASDQLQRAGEDFVSLPIINPQVVTERLIAEDLVEISFDEMAVEAE